MDVEVGVHCHDAAGKEKKKTRDRCLQAEFEVSPSSPWRL